MRIKTRIFNTLLALFIAGFSLTATAQPEHLQRAFEERFSPERIDALRSAIVAQERHQDALLALPGIVGTSVSWDEDDAAVIKIYTETDVSPISLPDTLDGLKVIIEPIGKIYAQNIPCSEREGCEEPLLVTPSSTQPPNQRDWHPRPVPIGVSSGHVDVTAGTLGCRVSNGCHKYALSNAHVYANENSGQVGDNVLQPGPTDGGIDPDDAIGTLFASKNIVMSTSPSTKNRIDAAIIETTANLVGTATRTNGYGEPISVDEFTALDASVGMQVQKYGRTTAITYGYVDAVNATVLVGYASGTARFVEQIIIKTNTDLTPTRPFSNSGDSGALIVKNGGTDDRTPVGLLFASGTEGGSGDHVTIANPINYVLQEFNVVIDGE